MRIPWAVPAALAGLAIPVAGCGHAVDPRAPYDQSAAVPPPRALVARVDLSQGIVLTWSASAADRTIVDGWLVERRTTSEIAFTRLTPVAIRDTTWVDGSAADGVRVVYRVRAVTAAGVAGPPAETAPLRADFVAPGAPTGVSAATSPEGITLTFTPGPESDIAFFEARLVPGTPGQPPLFRQFVASPAALGGLAAGVEYTIEVAAIDSAGRMSPPSTPPVTAVSGP
ncbi:MAG: fibronectin type III domain-containing protein [Candidatus Eisenbacteria bacterium]